MGKRKRLVEFPLRRCLSLHHCCECDEAIEMGQFYRDGGYDRRAHEKCAQHAEIEGR